jgi:hypothetical protein
LRHRFVASKDLLKRSGGVCGSCHTLHVVSRLDARHCTPDLLCFGHGGLAFGNVLFGATDAILRYTGAGHFLDAIVPNGSQALSALNEVRRFDIATGESDVFVPAGSGGLATPVGIAFGPDGHL